MGMKMHLNNILNQFEPDIRRITIRNHFKNQTVSHSAVVDLLKTLKIKKRSLFFGANPAIRVNLFNGLCFQTKPIKQFHYYQG
jgi:hypothetical protein